MDSKVIPMLLSVILPINAKLTALKTTSGALASWSVPAKGVGGRKAGKSQEGSKLESYCH